MADELEETIRRRMTDGYRAKSRPRRGWQPPPTPLARPVVPLLLDEWQTLIWKHGQHEAQDILDGDVKRWQESGLTFEEASAWLDGGAAVHRAKLAALLHSLGVTPDVAFLNGRRGGVRDTIWGHVVSERMSASDAAAAVRRHRGASAS